MLLNKNSQESELIAAKGHRTYFRIVSAPAALTLTQGHPSRDGTQRRSTGRGWDRLPHQRRRPR